MVCKPVFVVSCGANYAGQIEENTMWHDNMDVVLGPAIMSVKRGV